MPLPRIKTNFLLAHAAEDNSGRATAPVRCVVLPYFVVEQIVAWSVEFAIARVKAYHYGRFAHSYDRALHKSRSRLQLYSRELKSISMAYTVTGEPPANFSTFVKDTFRCKRTYDYNKLKGIFI